MTDYEKKTDEELIMDFRGGDTAIMDYLLEKYKPMVKKRQKPCICSEETAMI